MTPWREYKKEKKFPKLQNDLTVDVAIIGGGITGILNAYALTRAGKKVALIEKNELGTYATMDTTAFITEVIDTDLTQIASIFSEATAKAVWVSGMQAIDEHEKIVKEENIDCEFTRCPNYVFAATKKQFKTLTEEHEMYKRFKLPAKLVEDGRDLGVENYGYLEIPNQAKFHVTKYLYAVAEKAAVRGALIFENTCAKEISGTDPVTITTGRWTITAKDVIIATYKPITNKKTHLKKGMYRSYIFEVHIEKNIFKEALYEDMSNPYYYFRIDPQEGYDRMIVGGEDHKDIFGKTLVKTSFNALEKYLDRILEGRRYKIVKRWNGPILEPSDGLPLIGEIQPHYYVATAFSGNGMTYSMISSHLIRDLILGKKNPFEKVYTPQRLLLHPKRLAVKAKDYVQEFFGGAMKNLLTAYK